MYHILEEISLKDYGMISVIIPVYNVEEYIRQCLDSVINQTYKNLQIILIDDGSTDKSGIICDEYASKDNRITVVHQRNGGAGAAKNTGLELIKGKYFSIIDSDDYIETIMYSLMISKLQEYEVDIVQCLFSNVFKNKTVERKYIVKGKKIRKSSAKNFLREYLYDWKYAIFWNKLFKSSLLGDIRFPIGRKIDDEFFTYKLVCNANMVLNITDSLYYYRMRESSVMNETQNKRLIYDRIDCFIERYHYIASKVPKLSKYYYDKLSDGLVYYRNILNGDPKVDKLIEEYPIRKKTIFSSIKNRVINKKYNNLETPLGGIKFE